MIGWARLEGQLQSLGEWRLRGIPPSGWATTPGKSVAGLGHEQNLRFVALRRGWSSLVIQVFSIFSREYRLIKNEHSAGSWSFVNHLWYLPQMNTGKYRILVICGYKLLFGIFCVCDTIYTDICAVRHLDPYFCGTSMLSCPTFAHVQSFPNWELWVSLQSQNNNWLLNIADLGAGILCLPIMWQWKFHGIFLY